jgi:hypothetical protein
MRPTGGAAHRSRPPAPPARPRGPPRCARPTRLVRRVSASRARPPALRRDSAMPGIARATRAQREQAPSGLRRTTPRRPVARGPPAHTRAPTLPRAIGGAGHCPAAPRCLPALSRACGCAPRAQSPTRSPATRRVWYALPDALLPLVSRCRSAVLCAAPRLRAARATRRCTRQRW